MNILTASLLKLLALLLFCVPLLAKAADAVRLSDFPTGSLGVHAAQLVEGESALGLDEALAQLQAGGFEPVATLVPDFGIGSRPVWLHLGLDNDTGVVQQRMLQAGVTWLDRLDVYVVHADGSRHAVHTGDELPNALGLTPGMGYVLPLQLPPGRSELLLRVASVDPMALPVALLTPDDYATSRLQFGYFYGFFFGFLIALGAYNLLLFIGARERSYLYYALALLSVLFCNVAYTGHGAGWLWPQSTDFQRYVILVAMVVYNVFGLLFASRFLMLAQFLPRIQRVVCWGMGIAGGGMLLAVVMGSQLLAGLLAFVSMSAFSAGMFALGVVSVWRQRPSARYFLFATFFGMLGVGLTALAVWGKIPFSMLTFHAAEIGLVIEATLLALALAHWMRQHREARYLAEQVARQDALTQLNNRRAFLEAAQPLLDTAVRHERPLSLVMMDIDHFKSINDRYGHKTGDEALVAMANMLKRLSRSSDVVARWGGEEFILLLPETDQQRAVNHAERLRRVASELRIPAGDSVLTMTASFGIKTLQPNMTLETLIEAADVQLYEAKRSGRNKVCSEPFP
ncbi:MAG: sensor domain-containing diguanylate cyclase [Gammaproteobacteria bacterium]|nr:sensor domain-containing diguanylate cyclase [Gammaproteobacteria bacterium]MBU1625182.1 sensor domain-containing diguanylate cyclase [Gammaproteobacteria bacterium]MBU1981442.1 sensor domain-containing diguanylate cyclase [Gammaproteobacteria bacterium]